jgi:Arc/MetJ-type ribon-helix-helix transcriptional regulator
MLRLHQPLLGALDVWIADQPDPKSSRPEAIRIALADWLRQRGYLEKRSPKEQK